MNSKIVQQAYILVLGLCFLGGLAAVGWGWARNNQAAVERLTPAVITILVCGIALLVLVRFVRMLYSVTKNAEQQIAERTRNGQGG